MKWSVIADARDVGGPRDNRVVLFGHRGRLSSRPVLDTSSAVSKWMAPSAAGAREAVYILALTDRRRLAGLFVASLGAVAATGFDAPSGFVPMLQVALLLRAPMVIVVHNHPSGDPTPSAEDVVLTERITATARSIGVELVDHVILALDPERREVLSFSFSDAGLLERMRRTR